MKIDLPLIAHDCSFSSLLVIYFQIIDVQDPPPGSCTHSKAYIADVAGFSMLVYDASTDSSWRITNSMTDLARKVFDKKSHRAISTFLS